MRKLLLASAAIMGATFGLAGGAKAQPVKAPAPGTLVVHVNGYFQFELAGFGSTYNNVAGNKVNPVATNGDARFYLGFDAATLNGIDYGTQVETRVTTSSAGKGVGSATTSTAGTSSIYIRRAYGYIGAPQAGYVRLGQADSAFSLLQSGVVEAFGDGGQWNDDGGPYQVVPSAAVPGQFIYGDQGALYATSKVVYLSPSFSGVSFGIGYEPNSNALKQGYASCSYAGTGCNLESSPTLLAQRKNTVDGMVQYAVTTNGVAIKASAGYLYGQPVSYTGPETGAAPFGYNDLGVYQAGAQATFAGVTLGANIKGGQVEDAYGFKPKGGRDAFSYILSANYVVGPYVVGASFFDGQSSGGYIPNSSAVARTLSEYGVAVGGNYVLSKNLSLFAQYMYGHRHQPGNTYGVAGVTPATASGNAQMQLIAAGATFKW